MERLINTADEAVEIKESREDKGHTGDLRMRGKTPERERESCGTANEACSGWLDYVCAEDYLSWNDYRLPSRYSNRDQRGLGTMRVVKPARRPSKTT